MSEFLLKTALIVVCTFAAAPLAWAESLDTAHKRFTDPPREYSSGPLWVWNDLLTEDHIRSTLRDLASQGVMQAFVHPRPGLMTPYLGEDWFRLWGVALDEAEKLGMNIWIYDENSYPSGFAGGWVPEEMPESRGKGLYMVPREELSALGDDVLAVYAGGDGTYRDVTEQARAGELTGKGDYLVAEIRLAGTSPWFGGRSYVDLLKPGVTDKFLKVTLDPYAERFGASFGDRLPGSFTDEPHLRPAGGLHWTDDLPRVFERRWGYDLMAHLPSLVRDTGDWRRVRHNYFEVLLELFIERWAKPYHDYCERHGIEFTGHYWEHGWPGATSAPDNMAMYAFQQRPAIDTLFNRYGEDVHAQFGNVRSCLELASIANQMGTRTLCETYGGSGWDMRFEDIKRIGDWVFVLGVNTMNEHLSHISLRGARKRDYPVSFSYHEPWWHQYHVLTRYFTRLSSALTSGEQVNTMLVLEPTTTGWMYQSGNGDQLNALGSRFQELVTDLAQGQAEFDIGCEDTIARFGKVEDGKLYIGRRAYATVVIPPLMENVNSETMTLLEAYLRAGGEVIACDGTVPALVDGQPSERGAAAAGQNVTWRNVAAEDLLQALRAKSPDGFMVRRAPDDKGILYHHRRQLEDGELLFLVNTSIDHPTAGTVVSAASRIEEWDLATGERRPFASREGVFDFELPPSGSLLVSLSQGAAQRNPVAYKAGPAVEAVSELVVQRAAANVLTLDYMDVAAGGEERTDQYFHHAAQFVFNQNGFAHNPWDHAVQFRDEILSTAIPADTGFEAVYRFTIEGRVPPTLHFVVERPDLYDITCNGRKLEAKDGEWWLDRAFGKLDISECAVNGENKVRIKAAPFTVFHELENAYVVGDFALQATEKGFVVVPAQDMGLGPWNEQGCPLYGDAVAYTQRFRVDKPEGRFVVELPDWYGAMAEVRVNGAPTGVIYIEPFECEVTDHIVRGENTVEVAVYGTLKNTLGPHHGNPGLGFAGPRSWREAPNPGPPPGGAYDTLAYGLFAPMELRQCLAVDAWAQWAEREIARLKTQWDAAYGSESRQAQRAWEARFGWETLTPVEASASTDAVLTGQDDGSVRVSGSAETPVTYTVRCKAADEPVRGVRIEVLPDGSLPSNGPGRAFNGNFVLNELRLLDGEGRAIPLRQVSASFEQEGFPLPAAVDGDAAAGSGWAINGGTGKRQAAVFATDEPVDAGQELTFELVQTFSSEHVLGRFRLAATASETLVDTAPEVEAALKVPPEQRSAEQREKVLQAWLTAEKPELLALRERIAGLEEELGRQ